MPCNATISQLLSRGPCKISAFKDAFEQCKREPGRLFRCQETWGSKSNLDLVVVAGRDRCGGDWNIQAPVGDCRSAALWRFTMHCSSFLQHV